VNVYDEGFEVIWVVVAGEETIEYEMAFGGLVHVRPIVVC
jgi:hypothetical protein